MEQDIVDILLIGSYALLGLAALAAIVLPLINAIGNPKTIVMGAIGVVLIMVVYGIAFMMSGSEVTPIYAKFGIDAGLSQFVGASIITVYILVVVSIVGIVLTEISKIFN